jgi:hypothetical protein
VVLGCVNTLKEPGAVTGKASSVSSRSICPESPFALVTLLRVTTDVRTFKKLSLSPAPPCPLEIHPRNLSAKNRGNVSRTKRKKNVVLSKALFSRGRLSGSRAAGGWLSLRLRRNKPKNRHALTRDGFSGIARRFCETPFLGFRACSQPLSRQACSFQAGRSLFGFALPAL